MLKVIVHFALCCLNTAFIVLPNTRHNYITSSHLAAERTATFGMGCFWKPSEELLKVPGVIDTVVGYTGNPQATGDKIAAPSYESVCMGRDWVEGVRVTFDDKLLSYPQLLDAFFEAQEPKHGYRQYASIIFSHDHQQKALAEEWLNRDARVRKDGVSTIMTTIEDSTPFFQAENYHQHYWQKTRPRMATLIALLAVSSGILDAVTPLPFQTTVHIAANALALAGSFFVMAERFLDRKVIKLE